jgi:hypothetical protein
MLSRVPSLNAERMMRDNRDALMTHEFTSDETNILRRNSFAFRDVIPAASTQEYKDANYNYPESRV